jgi:hypothetical protein
MCVTVVASKNCIVRISVPLFLLARSESFNCLSNLVSYAPGVAANLAVQAAHASWRCTWPC